MGVFFFNGEKFNTKKEKPLCIINKKPHRNTIKTSQPSLETISIKTVFGDLFDNFFLQITPHPKKKYLSFIKNAKI